MQRIGNLEKKIELLKSWKSKEQSACHKLNEVLTYIQEATLADRQATDQSITEATGRPRSP